MSDLIPNNQPTDPTPPNAVPLIDASSSIHLTIRNTQKIVFDEIVKSITSINQRGVFDILPLHENFISLIQKYITIHKTNGENQTMEIENGIVYVTKNEVRCYINLLAAPQAQPEGEAKKVTQ